MANTMKGRKLYICATPQAIDLNQAAFEALTFVEVKNVGMIGDFGITDNLVSYDELATVVNQKQKGIGDAGSPQVDMSENPTDPGQILMRTAGDTKYQYAFKVENADATSASESNTIYYFRAVVSGPLHPGGRNQDFLLERYTLGINQKPIKVAPAALSAPTNTTLPAISGLIETGELLTAYEGIWTGNPTFTYQWQHDSGGNNVFTNIGGATSRTFTAVVGDVGNALRVVVTGTNSAGATAANSEATVVQGA